ncbi:NAD-dependent epimerase/dehydratase family protein [Streptomyces sp. NPDC058664]|uniref:NAD-dependent epimerase/dehydratase family protein n=1 Tax=unclassified Streptomyces TaxID=2593676 RepID=UPI0036640C57
MRVAVTGGGGFLGSHLCETLLRRGDSVVCLDNFSTGDPREHRTPRCNETKRVSARSPVEYGPPGRATREGHILLKSLNLFHPE